MKAWGFGTDPRAKFACAGAAQMPVRRGSFHRMKDQKVFPFSVSGGEGFSGKLASGTLESGLEFETLPWREKLLLGLTTLS